VDVEVEEAEGEEGSVLVEMVPLAEVVGVVLVAGVVLVSGVAHLVGEVLVAVALQDEVGLQDVAFREEVTEVVPAAAGEEEPVADEAVEGVEEAAGEDPLSLLSLIDMLASLLPKARSISLSQKISPPVKLFMARREYQ